MNLMNNCASPAVDVILKYNIRRCSMYTTRLKKVGGSIMLAVPPAVLKTLELSTDSEVGMTIGEVRSACRNERRRSGMD